MVESLTNTEATKVPLPTSGGGLGSIRAWDLPLLMKELQELAARPRTYQLRVGYAAALLVISFGVLMANVPRAGTSTVSGLGYGAPVLTSLNLLQELGLYLVLPALACSTLTIEKERKTLDLLLITKLGPWTIIFEKFLSQVVAAVNLLLLSLPLLAFSYSLGGISPERLWIALLGLFLTIIRLAAVGIFCSAVFQTTTRALLGTYALIALACVIEQGIQFSLIPTLNRYLRPNPGLDVPPLLNMLFDSPGILTLFRSNLILSYPADFSVMLRLVFGCLPSLVCSFAFIALARYCLVPPVHGSVKWLLQRPGFSFRKTRIPRDARDVPLDDPIAWREGPRGNPTWWWIRNVCFAALPLGLSLTALYWCLDNDSWHACLILTYLVIWLAVTVRLCSHSATLLIPERVHQTLDLLCCTPMTSGDMMRQKMRSVERQIQICRVPLIVCVIVRTIFLPSVIYLILSSIIIWLYPPVIAYQAVSCGVRMKNGAGAIVKSLLVTAGWCFLPYLAISFILPLLFLGGSEGPGIFVMIVLGSVSPLTLLGITETFPDAARDLSRSGAGEMILYFLMLIVGTVAVHGVRLTRLSDWLKRDADSFLRGQSQRPGDKFLNR
ncbi:MAG: gliding motility-associated transporter permease protein [Planctomycetaceae bacterium]|nr:gliding motility-associated transporter permease protein [Planctomycetaceae bacterium]